MLYYIVELCGRGILIAVCNCAAAVGDKPYLTVLEQSRRMETDQTPEGTQCTVSAVVRSDFEARESEVARGAGSGGVAPHGSEDPKRLEEAYEEGLVAPPSSASSQTGRRDGRGHERNRSEEPSSSKGAVVLSVATHVV